WTTPDPRAGGGGGPGPPPPISSLSIATWVAPACCAPAGTGVTATRAAKAADMANAHRPKSNVMASFPRIQRSDGPPLLTVRQTTPELGPCATRVGGLRSLCNAHRLRGARIS